MLLVTEFGSSVLDGPGAVFVDKFFPWSIGHKVYWGAFYLLGVHCGQNLIQRVQRNEYVLKSLVNTPIKCLSTACLLVLWYLQRHFTDSFLPNSPLGAGDFPNFFDSPQHYVMNVAFDLAQMGALIFAVGINNKVLMLCGKGMLVTFMIHVYLRPMLLEIITYNVWFALLGHGLFQLGGFVQLAIIISIPMSFAMMIGAGTHILFYSHTHALQITANLQEKESIKP